MPTADICLTSNELTAIARHLGAPRFPGVFHTSYDEVGADLHAALDRRCLGSLAARDLLVPDDGGELWPTEALAVLIDAVAAHRVYIVVDQVRPASDPGVSRTCSVMVGERGIVRHGIADPLHVLELEPGTTALVPRLGSLLGELVDHSQGRGNPERRRWRGPRSGLAGLIPPPTDGWRRATVLARTDDVEERGYVDGFLAIFDGGPGELWLVTEDDGYVDLCDRGDLLSRSVVGEPASPSEVDAALRAFASLETDSWPDGDGPVRGSSTRSHGRTVDRWRG